jgi:hypothetical protein
MTNPWRGFTNQPWLELAKIAGVTLLAVIAIEWFIAGLISLQNTVINGFFMALLNPPLGFLVPFLAVFGIGVLGVYFSERWRQPLYLNSGTLWALVLCLVVALWLKSLLPLPIFQITQLSQPALIMILLGVFMKGRPYW